MINPYENGEPISSREGKATEEPQSSTKFKKFHFDPNENDERYKEEMFRTYKTQKKKFLGNQSVLLKI